MTSNDDTQQGFTAIEMLITIIVAAIFVTSFYMLFSAINSASALARHKATASELAYSYLRTYASAGSTPTWFTCSTASGSSNTNDVTINSNAPGQVLQSGSLAASTVSLPGPVSYSVKAWANYGCSGTNLNKPLRVEAQITYGPTNTVIKHVTYVGYSQ